MSTFAVTAEQLIIETHPNADALEVAIVGGYRAVVLKGQFRTGDWAIYIPEQALLPAALVDELGLTGRLAGKAGNRVKAIHLRTELSQGIVCRPTGLAGVDLAAAAAEGYDFAADLGIEKWVPEVPANMSGKVESASDLLDWIEIENIKRYLDTFVPGEMVSASEKIHGSATLISYVPATGRLLVSSKGFGSRHLALVEEPNNLYWRAVRLHGVEAAMASLSADLEASVLALYGETYGAGVQDLTYGVTSRNTPGLAIFDAYLVRTDGAERWLEQDELRDLLAPFGLSTVPELYRGPYDYGTITAISEGTEMMSGRGLNLREGVVVRAVPERRSDVLGGRAIAKFVSESYLTRGGNVTEFE